MQNDNHYKKLRYFALCLAIICMLLSLIKRAKAEVPNDVISSFSSDLDNYTDANETQINECLNYLSNYEYFYWIKTVSGTSNRHQEIFVAYNDADLMFRVNNNDTTNNRVFDIQRTKGIMTYGAKSSVEAYIIYLNQANSNLLTTKWTSSQTNGNYTNNRKTYNLQNSSPFDDISNASSSAMPTSLLTPLNECTVIYNNDIYMYSLSGSSLQNIGTFKKLSEFTNTTVYTPPSSTAGFECYKLDTKGGIYFYADFSNLISISNAVGNSSTFSCNVHLNDTVQTITLDSTSEYYQYSVIYNEAYYSFPITAFIPNIAEYDNVWIDSVKVINTTSSAGGLATNTFIYITPIVIQGDTYNNGDLINPNDVIIPNGEYEPPTNIEITENTYLVEFSNKDGLSFSEFHNTVIPNIYENNTTWVYMDKQTYNFRDFIEDFLGLNFPPKLIKYITGVNTEEDAVEQMTNYLYDNAFTLTSDMVVFVYIDGDWKSGDFTSNDLTYWIYYTASGRIRAISQLMNSTNTNISRQLALSSSYYQYAKTKLNTIDKNLYELANTQLGFNNSFLSKLNNIDTLLSRIENVLNKILDALKNLHLNQLDTIDTKLSTIISNMGNSSGGFNEDDTVAEAIQYYKSHNNNGVPTTQVYIDDKMSIWISGKVHLWLQGTDANTDKTNMINSVFDTLSSIYDSMKNNNNIFPNIQYYLDAIAKNNNYGYETHGDYMTRLFKGNVDISTYDGISE